MTKDELRKQALIKRDSLEKGVISSRSQKVFEKLTALLTYKKAENILIYASMRSEVITDEIILDALSAGKKVFCPKVLDRDKGLMRFIEIDALKELKEGYFGIREPFAPSEYVEPRFDPEKSLIVMPLVCFDKDRNRIGYSGGFYDRYLSVQKDIRTVAIAFECQKTDCRIPATDHDIAPDMIVTEESIY